MLQGLVACLKRVQVLLAQQVHIGKTSQSAENCFLNKQKGSNKTVTISLYIEMNVCYKNVNILVFSQDSPQSEAVCVSSRGFAVLSQS